MSHPVTDPARRPEDDALDLLRGFHRGDPFMAERVATVREALERLQRSRDSLMAAHGSFSWAMEHERLLADNERLREERDAMREQNRAMNWHVRRLTEGLRDFDEKWYPTLASRAIIEEQSYHPTAAAIWGQLCRDFRALLSASPTDGGGAKCPNSRCNGGWVAYEPNESGGAPPIACRHEDCPHGGGAK
jgi:hypothetical protein